MVTDDASQGTVKSDKTLISIINSLHEKGAAGVTEFSNELDLSKSTVHKHLKSLEKEDLVYKDTNDMYRLGFRFLTYGGAVRDTNNLCQNVASKVKEINADTAETCAFAVEEHGYGIYTHLQWGEHSIPQTQPLGERFHLHKNSSGKAILAQMSDERIESIIEMHGMPAQTSNTITNKGHLFEEIERTRERGYAVNNEERFKGIRSIATGIKHPQTEQVGAISMAAPATRLQKEEVKKRYGNLLRNTINEIKLQLQVDL